MVIILDGYIRVSQVRGRRGESFISPDVQRTQIQRWADLREVAIGEWHIDLDQSGAKDNRPGLKRALERIDTHQTDGIVVAKLDRFARSLTAALEMIKRIDDAGAKFVSVTEGIDPTTPAGKLQQNIMLVFAEFELDRIRDSWQTARSRAVARGVHIASRTPTGYARLDDGRLAPHPRHGRVITRLFQQRASGDPWSSLSETMHKEKVPSPYHNKIWTTTAVANLISNRVYLGEARSGEFTNAEAHEPLIDRVTWEAAQRARTVSRSRSGKGSLLAGILRCAGCRYALKPDTMREPSTGKTVRIYRCRGKHASGECPNRSAVMGRLIEPLVENHFLGLASTISAHGSWAELDEASRELEEAEAELRAYRDNERIATTLGTDLFLEGLQPRVKAVDDATQRLGLVYRVATGNAEIHQVDLCSLWPDLDHSEKQKLMLGMYDGVMLRSGRGLPLEDRVHFVLAGDGDDDMPRRGRRGPIRSFAWPDSPAATGIAASKDT